MRRASLLVIALVLPLGAAGCGGQKRTIPTGRAEAMLTQLDGVAGHFDAGQCASASAAAASLESKARALPSSVDPEVKRNLIAGIVRLQGLVTRDCRRKPSNTTTTTTPTVTTPTTTTTTPTTTTTTPTNTTTTPTNTTPTNTNTTPSTTPTTGGGGGGVTVPGTGTGGLGNGNPNGNGNGNG